jgi:molybdate transport system substrate-binding protein
MSRRARPTLAAVALTAVSMLLPALWGCDRQEAAQRPHVRVAAAADLKHAMPPLVEAFNSQHPDVRVDVTYGSSGNFHAQLRQRAPFDLYLSADVAYAQSLVDAGIAAGQAVHIYAIGRIVTWAPHDRPVPLEDVGSAQIRRIAIANPAHAPYGRAAVAALRARGLYEQVEDRLVLGENVAQAAQFAESGAADVGIIALSLAMAPPMRAAGRYHLVPAELHEPIKQGMLVLPWARHRDGAEALGRFILSRDGRAVLEQFGFEMPR